MRPPVRLLLVIAAVAAVSAACDDSTAPIAQAYESLPADQVMNELDHLITSDGVRRAHLLADTAYMFEDSAMTHLRGVHLEMYDDAGAPSSTLTSEKGAYNESTQATVARGNVIVVKPGPEGFTMWTEELHYDPATKRIWSDVPTRMLMNTGEDLHVQQFTSDDQFSNISTTGGAGTGLPLPLDGR